jgi:hypothetical protein
MRKTNLVISLLFLVFSLTTKDQQIRASDVDTGLEQGKSFSGQLQSQYQDSLIPNSSNEGNVPQYSNNTQGKTSSSPEAPFLNQSANTHPVFNIGDSDPDIQNYQSIQQAIENTYKGCQIQDQCLNNTCTTTVTCNGEVRCEFGVDCFDSTYQQNTDYPYTASVIGSLKKN